MKRLPVLAFLKIFIASSIFMTGSAMAKLSPEVPPVKNPVDAVCLLTIDGTPQLNKTNCRVYINGFLDGAELTDSVIIDKVRDRSPFFERAYATRVGAGKDPFPVTYYADFCIDKNLSRQKVVDRVMTELERDKTAAKDERSAVYTVIKRLYACDVK